MEAVLLDEIIEKTAKLTDDERQKLIRVLQRREGKPKKNGGKSIVQPNIEWLKKHRAEYAGNYVALKDGELIAFGRTIKEADLKSKEKGVKNPLLHYIVAEDEEVWGGW
ncbi:MAG TPA: DUF5678 domain-containing protein [Pyrinomonadaceae bacterium]|nr:DUF5678 domain-containing protein [Pyrinomonadaceae bacterium]